jgi:hypothetical protein
LHRSLKVEGIMMPEPNTEYLLCPDDAELNSPMALLEESFLGKNTAGEALMEFEKRHPRLFESAKNLNVLVREVLDGESL